MMVNDGEKKLRQEYQAWGKLERKLSNTCLLYTSDTESRLRSQEKSSSAARRSCTAAIRGFGILFTRYGVSNLLI